jgi:hypothetical protein
MKKLSISLFAVLAIAFAVTSAFSVPTTVGDYKWHQLVGPGTTVQGDYDQTELTLAELAIIDELCISTTDDEICAAKFRFDSDNPTNALGANLQTGEVVEFRYIQED